MPSEAYEIRYGTEKHRLILEALLARLRKSKDKMEPKYADFKKREEQFLAYMPERDADALRRIDREQNGNPQYTTITVPYSYAQLMTAHTYWTTVFLARNPIWQFSGRHGEPESAKLGVEALMDYQTLVGRMLVPLYCWLLDPGKYGFGAVGSYWADEKEVVSTIVEKPVTIAGFAIAGKTRKVKEIRIIRGYQGNKIFNVSPRNFFPDPTVPLSRMQEGEFVGRTTTMGWNEIVRREEDGEYFNINVLKQMVKTPENRDSIEGTDQMDWPEDTNRYESIDITNVGQRDILEMSVELIPREWKVGSSSYPEKWVFTVGDEKVIIGAKPLGLYHNKHPFDVIEYEPEAYAFTNRSLLETIAPLNDVMTWLVNSHMYNVRQTLNNQFIGDPSRISLRDLQNPDPGFIARVKPNGYGQDVRTMYAQLPVADVTQNHLRDMQVMERLTQIVTGVNDNIMGMVNQGGRKTATEVRSSSTYGTNRLKTTSEYFSAMGFSELAQKLLMNTQQYYDQEQKFKIVGDLVQGSDPFTMVTPQTIAGNYDFIPVDGTLPVDKFAQANLWRQIFADLKSFPAAAQQLDLMGIFSYVAKLAGAKNFDQFRLKVVPDQQLQEQAQAGNMVPVKEAAADAMRQAGEPGQIAQLGRTG